MRIIEPRQKKRTKANFKLILPIIFIIIVVIIGFVFLGNKDKKSGTVSVESKVSREQNDSVLGTSNKSTQKYTDQQFRDTYNSMAYPNTKEFSTPPHITGIASIDNQIQKEAVKRGYQLRGIANLPIFRTSTKDELQQKAILPWEEMKKFAQKSNVNLRILASYRSVEDQRTLFVESLRKNGFDINNSSDGSTNAINKTLQRVAPPGYSRHHTGYTIDIACPNELDYVFEKSSCFKWLSKNNYENTKKFGWIPSYPNNTNLQGPEPEPWEYVWVGLTSN